MSKLLILTTIFLTNHLSKCKKMSFQSQEAKINVALRQFITHKYLYLILLKGFL